MKILLVCNAGMSTSLIVEKMKEYSQGNDIIEAHPITYLKDHVTEWDVVLVGPQIRYKEKEVKKLCNEYGKVSGLIDMMDYGQGNGQNIYNEAQKLYKEHYE
ncbi:PTS sugar transporter subunit IIB [Mollicutes bacterium LVI A0078]|nr:PTS sugar transporter subunit IIB [Mollicutes bacterium LVI A0075]WOO90208.1 PTS sugar transporter subunit IIB [Mollicutes bacterium LVI A0078]